MDRIRNLVPVVAVGAISARNEVKHSTHGPITLHTVGLNTWHGLSYD